MESRADADSAAMIPPTGAAPADPPGRVQFGGSSSSMQLEGHAARGGIAVTSASSNQDVTGLANQRANVGSVDVRLPYERPKSKKLNRTSSYQYFVDVEGWLKAFPEITIEDLGPGFTPGSFVNNQGLKIATYAWRQPEPPKAAIVLFHSYTSYTLFDFLRHQPPGASNSDTREEDPTWVPKYPGKQSKSS